MNVFHNKNWIKDETNNDLLPPWRSSGISQYKSEQLAYDSPINWQREERLTDDIDIEYSMYRRNPENHPQYKIERENFFEKRFKNFQKDYIDPFNCDFETEWLNFWKTRLDILHKKDVENEKLFMKEKIQLPWNREHSPSLNRRRSRSLKPPPLPPKPEEIKRYERRYSKSPEYVNHRLRNEIDEPQDEREPLKPLNVISVLAQLTILEEELDTLGPKALEFHSTAMLFEEDNKSPANELLKQQEFYIFFVSAKEKLKIKLSKNIVEVNRMKIASSTVSNIQALLDMFENHIRQNARNNPIHANESTTNLNETTNFNNQWSPINQDNLHRNEFNFVENANKNSKVEIVEDLTFNNIPNDCRRDAYEDRQLNCLNVSRENYTIPQRQPLFGDVNNYTNLDNVGQTQCQDNNVSWLTVYLNRSAGGGSLCNNQGEFNNDSQQCNRKRIQAVNNSKNLYKNRNFHDTGKKFKMKGNRGIGGAFKRNFFKKNTTVNHKAKLVL